MQPKFRSQYSKWNKEGPTKIESGKKYEKRKSPIKPHTHRHKQVKRGLKNPTAKIQYKN